MRLEHARNRLYRRAELVSPSEKRLARGRWRILPLLLASYDVEKLASALVAQTPGRRLAEIRFYTGVPQRSADSRWHDFWSNKIRFLRSRGVYVYRGRVNSGGQEKGVDVSLSLDLVVAAYERRFDVAIIVSQDSDFAPAVQAAKRIAQNQGRFSLHSSPLSPQAPAVRRRAACMGLSGFE